MATPTDYTWLNGLISGPQGPQGPQGAGSGGSGSVVANYFNDEVAGSDAIAATLYTVPEGGDGLYLYTAALSPNDYFSDGSSRFLIAHIQTDVTADPYQFFALKFQSASEVATVALVQQDLTNSANQVGSAHVYLRAGDLVKIASPASGGNPDYTLVARLTLVATRAELEA